MRGSAWSFVTEATFRACVANLRGDLATGEWDKEYGYLRTRPEFDDSLRLLVSRSANS